MFFGCLPCCGDCVTHELSPYFPYSVAFEARFTQSEYQTDYETVEAFDSGWIADSNYIDLSYVGQLPYTPTVRFTSNAAHEPTYLANGGANAVSLRVAVGLESNSRLSPTFSVAVTEFGCRSATAVVADSVNTFSSRSPGKVTLRIAIASAAVDGSGNSLGLPFSVTKATINSEGTTISPVPSASETEDGQVEFYVTGVFDGAAYDRGEDSLAWEIAFDYEGKYPLTQSSEDDPTVSGSFAVKILSVTDASGNNLLVGPITNRGTLSPTTPS